MVTRDDVESYLLRMELDFEEIAEGMWVVRNAAEGAGLVINHTPPVLVFRAKVLEMPEDESQQISLFRRLLELNATDLVHGAYALEEGDVILTETLELENLDFSEFQATVDSLFMALSGHVEELAPFRERGKPGVAG